MPAIASKIMPFDSNRCTQFWGAAVDPDQHSHTTVVGTQQNHYRYFFRADTMPFCCAIVEQHP